MGTGFSKKKKQARMLQAQLSEMQTKMQHSEATGSAGNGLVTLTLSGEYELKTLRINPECVDKEDIEGLQDLIKAAYQDAKKKLETESPLNKMQMPPGTALPGMFGM
jgi:DNA-binding YbaB/EbfC family protein